MADDPLDKEKEISVGGTQIGKLSGKTNLRAINAIDRLVGNFIDLGNMLMEPRLAEKRATMEARRQWIAAVTDQAVARLESDSEFARRAIASEFDQIFSKQLNREAVAELTIEDLRGSDWEEEGDGPEVLSEEFMSRFRTHADWAFDEELRIRWAAVLSIEIRKPGTFSSRALRAIDELDAETARVLARIAYFRIGPDIPRCLLPDDIGFEALLTLAEAEFLNDPGNTTQGHVLRQDEDEEGHWIGFTDEHRMLVVEKEPNKIWPSLATDSPHMPAIVEFNSGPAVPIFRLTRIGEMVSRILPAADGHDLLAAEINKLDGARASVFRWDPIQQEYQGEL